VLIYWTLPIKISDFSSSPFEIHVTQGTIYRLQLPLNAHLYHSIKPTMSTANTFTLPIRNVFTNQGGSQNNSPVSYSATTGAGDELPVTGPTICVWDPSEKFIPLCESDSQIRANSQEEQPSRNPDEGVPLLDAKDVGHFLMPGQQV
jgi:hypothetical protein